MLIVPEWPEDVACRDIPLDLFYVNSTDALNINPMLRKLCRKCPALTVCRDYARRHEAEGFWGGESAGQRKQWRRAHGVTLERIGVDGFLIERGAA